MIGQVGLYSAERAKEISDSVNQLMQFEQGETGHQEHDPERWYFVKAKEDIPASSNPETGYTVGKVTPLRYTDTDNRDMEVSPISTESELELTNRTTSSIAEGDYFWCRQIEAEIVPFINSEATGGGGGDSCCVTLHNPNVELITGEWTTTRRILCSQIGDILDSTEPNLEIVISFPPPESMVLLKESDSDTYVWTFDETEVTITATYLDGLPATVTSLDGTVMFTPHNSGRTELVISWTVVVPEQVIEEEFQGVVI